MADVFVSYAREDKARVAPLVAALEGQGWAVWWDPAIAPGQEFDRLIATELSGAAAVVVVWTAASVESRWVRGEAREAADRGILVPVRFGDAQLPIDFRALHTADLGDGENLERSSSFRDVVSVVGTLVARRDASRSRPAGPEPVSAPAANHSPPTIRAAICVMPFSNQSGDAEQQALSEGMAEDIITELSRWRRLDVRSRSASFKYRGRAVEIGQVARELNVRYVVEGSVRRIGERIRIGVQLIDATTGSQVWGERFDRPQAEIFAVQDEVVRTIVSTLVGRVQVLDVERARRKPPASLEAYECVLKGNALSWDDPAGLAEAGRLFEKATQIDPTYGLGYALQAAIQITIWRADLSAPDTMLDDAYRLGLRAVELDDGESTCHSLLAQVAMCRRSYELALQHIQRSIELNPNNQWNTADMAYVLSYAGRAEEALAWSARATQIDPYFDPPWHWRQTGIALMVLRRFEEALVMFARVPSRTFRDLALMAGCHARTGHAERARELVAATLALEPAFSVERFMTKEPFRSASDADELRRSLEAAGLPR
jgi:TolB-like protein